MLDRGIYRFWEVSSEPSAHEILTNPGVLMSFHILYIQISFQNEPSSSGFLNTVHRMSYSHTADKRTKAPLRVVL